MLAFRLQAILQAPWGWRWALDLARFGSGFDLEFMNSLEIEGPIQIGRIRVERIKIESNGSPLGLLETIQL